MADPNVPSNGFLGLIPSNAWHPSQANWYDPTSWGNYDLSTDADRMNQQRQGLLNTQGAAAANFASGAQYNYNADTGELGQSKQFLQGLASGQNSISQEQLRQGLQQQLAQQQSMAAGASPQNAAMAARNAAMNMGRASYGMSGQQALAGLQERQQAQSALGQLLLGQRGQDLQGFLGANQNSMTAYGAQAPQSAATQMSMGAIGGLAGGLGTALGKSDRTAKTEVKDGTDKARAMLAAIKPYSYRYKDERDGAGDQFGVMAQDLEKAGLGHAVVNTPAGKFVHGAKAATSALALSAALAKRVEQLEKGRDGRGARDLEDDDEGED